ncbi:serine/threonine-protein phosphatase 2A 55 kDa regulatory subunit B alpha isoform-like [Tropilaelaps mercedesae]|uniref:Serine/threonine-protein phosphatase 2A 55 kDa regulatory subunit B alpha isoform-like n=1 Tax=Tropilaelaps mercedesae TaxID=418985 RepID=A0A1V9XMI3_9ACAR|nr:serine/threonine-protein phosphatase 2A 55 kDa regulatory subunit B alpha isoform-like [Tropilaelaps mercedesae]
MTGSYKDFFRVFDCNIKRDVIPKTSIEITKPRPFLQPRRVCATAPGVSKCKKEKLTVDCLSFNQNIFRSAWYPQDKILVIAATRNHYLFTEPR